MLLAMLAAALAAGCTGNPGEGIPEPAGPASRELAPHLNLGLGGPSPLWLPDGGPPWGPGCGPLTIEGCCLGTTLVYCQSSQLLQTDCTSSPQCGWSTVTNRYACGTAGGADPAAKFPKACTDYGDDAGVDGSATDLGPVVCGDGKCTSGAESCVTCTLDCGACDGCQITATPSCPGCKCETCVCALDADCCKYSWDAICVGECTNLCGGCGLGPSPDGLVLPDLGSSEGGAVVCGDGICSVPSEACDSCSSDCGTCDGCQAKPTPKCPGCKCETCVCALDPDCCKYAWDAVCVGECTNLCGGCGLGPSPDGLVLPDLGSPEGGSAEGGTVTCGDGTCSPSETCESCPSDCGACDGCQAKPTPKCPGCKCETCVCALDPDCCKYAWDATCISECKDKCGGCGLLSGDGGGDGVPGPDQGPDRALTEAGSSSKDGSANEDISDRGCSCTLTPGRGAVAAGSAPGAARLPFFLLTALFTLVLTLSRRRPRQ